MSKIEYKELIAFHPGYYLKEMIEYAHIREVRVHVVINTLIYDDEMDKVMEFVDFLYNADVDAIIVQDLGVITLVHAKYPDLGVMFILEVIGIVFSIIFSIFIGMLPFVLVISLLLQQLFQRSLFLLKRR